MAHLFERHYLIGESGAGDNKGDVIEVTEVERAPSQRKPLRFALLGHSTGCQDIVTLLKRQNKHGEDVLRTNQKRKMGRELPLPKVVAAVLQGPVSDRQWLESTAMSGGKEVAKSTGFLHDIVRKRIAAEEGNAARGGHDALVGAKNSLLPMSLTSPWFGQAPFTVQRMRDLLVRS